MKNPPQKIYLNIGTDNKDVDFKDLHSGEITWSKDRINDSDIEYTLSKPKDYDMAGHVPVEREEETK